MKTSLLPGLLLLALASSPIHADPLTGNGLVTVTTGVAPPEASHVVISHPLPPGQSASAVGMRWRNDLPEGQAPRVDVGQTFRPETSFKPGQVTILANLPIEVSNQFTLTIETFAERSRQRPDFDVAATPVAILSGNTLPVTDAANTYLSFDLSAIDLTFEEGTLYGFRLGFDGPLDGARMSWGYVGGQPADYYERTPAYSMTYDPVTGLPETPARVNGIAVYYVTQAIPEPGMTGLLGLGALCAWGFFARGRKG